MRLWNVDEASDTAVKLSGPDGMRIVLWSGAINFALEDGDEDKIKFEVSGEFPPDTFIMPEDKPKINVSYSRGAKAVARDIERRFLSKYVPLYYEKLEIQKKIERDRNARERVMATLQEWFGFKEIRDRDGHLDRLETENNRTPYRGRVTASYRIAPSSQHMLFDPEKSERRWEVDIKLERLTVDQALRIAEVLREPAFPSEQLKLL
jgi:hypothetical protein